MTVKEAAKRIGISVSKLYQLVSSRRIGHFRVGGKVLIGDEDVQAYLQTCRVEPVVKPQPRAMIRLKHLNI